MCVGGTAGCFLQPDICWLSAYKSGEMRCTREGRLGSAVAQVAAEEGQGEDGPPCSLKT